MGRVLCWFGFHEMDHYPDVVDIGVGLTRWRGCMRCGSIWSRQVDHNGKPVGPWLGVELQWVEKSD